MSYIGKSNPSVRLLSFCTLESISGYSFSWGLGTFEGYRSIYTKKESLFDLVDKELGNVVVAVDAQDEIVGFGVVDRPRDDEIWAQVGDKHLMEVKALEVSRGNRSLGLAPLLLQMMLKFPLVEEKIIFLAGYSWTWDLDGSCKSVVEYRNKLNKLYGAWGFKEYPTNDFNICLKPENIFMARVGRNVPQKVCREFKWSCFGQIS